MIGYGIGYIGDGSTYNFMSAYFVVFLTNCVGMNSSLAAAVSSIALLVEVIAGMIVGHVSDNCNSRMGRRRPFILVSAICMPVIMVMIMRTIHASAPIMFFYYLVLSILFRAVFATYEIPVGAFGAEIATGYDERTSLRTITRAFSILGSTIGYVMPLMILDFFQTEAEGWQAIGTIIAVACGASWLGTFFLTRSYAANPQKHEKRQDKIIRNIIKSYIELSKLKTMRILIVYKAAFTCAFSLFNVGTVYYLQNCLGLGNKYSSYMYILTICVFVIMTPIAGKMALHLGKAVQQKIIFLFSGTVGCIVYFTIPETLAGGIMYIIAFAMTQTSFWQLSNSIFYDVVEVDEFENSKRREGDIMSMVSVLGTLITAIIVQVFGVFLEIFGFNSTLEIQPESVKMFLNAAYILVPSVCFIIGYFALKVFPVNKNTFSSLLKALELRRRGKDYSRYMEDVKKLL